MRIAEAKQFLAGVIKYNLEQLERGANHNTYVVPMIVGDPGVGKTAIVKQVASEFDLPYFQCIIAQYDAGELAGLPFKTELEREIEAIVEGKPVTQKVTEDRMVRLRPNYLPDAPVGVFNLDELPQGFLANQNIASQLVNEWCVGEHEISDGITIIGTGNKPENKAGTTTMPTHLRDRLTFIELNVNVDDWMSYAVKNGVDPRIRAWLHNHPDRLHKFDPKLNSYPTPRSWEKCSALLSMNLPKTVRTQALGGQIGEGEAMEFETFLRVEDKMPDTHQLIANPEDKEKAPVFTNKEADVLYLLLGTLADMADEKNIENILKYIDRLPNQEFAAYFAKQAFTRNKDLLQNKVVTKWKIKSIGKLLY